jgi:hypothetical protein
MNLKTKISILQKLAKASQLLAEAQLLCLEDRVWNSALGEGRAYLDAVVSDLIRVQETEEP